LIQHLLAISLAIVIDRVIGDLKHLPHPVRWFGQLISFFEERLNKNRQRKLKGIVMVLLVIAIAVFITYIIITFCYSLHPFVGIISEALLISTTIAQKSLKDAGMEVYYPLKKGDLTQARTKLSHIVGRDTDQLEEAEIVRGTVETIAENTSDGITAPLFWSLIGGAPLAIFYRVVNTCDSMVGHKNEKYAAFGWASARLDDILNWIPSRITGFLMILTKKPTKRKWRLLFRDAKKHASPNSGWCETAVAIQLGVQLGGSNTYEGVISHRAKIGEEIVPLASHHIIESIQMMNRTIWLFFLLLWIGGICFEAAFSWF